MPKGFRTDAGKKYMGFRVNHIHVKAADPAAAADWFVAAFGFKILGDVSRPDGNRFIRCLTGDDSLNVTFSGARTGEIIPKAPQGSYLGLEHIGFDSTDIKDDLRRLQALGAVIEDGPMMSRNGNWVALVTTPHGMRIELLQKP